MCEYIEDTDRDDGTDEKKASFALIEGKQSNRDFIGHIQLTLARLAHTFGLPTTIKVTEMIDVSQETLHIAMLTTTPIVGRDLGQRTPTPRLERGYALGTIARVV